VTKPQAQEVNLSSLDLDLSPSFGKWFFNYLLELSRLIGVFGVSVSD